MQFADFAAVIEVIANTVYVICAVPRRARAMRRCPGSPGVAYRSGSSVTIHPLQSKVRLVRLLLFCIVGWDWKVLGFASSFLLKSTIDYFSGRHFFSGPTMSGEYFDLLHIFNC